MDQAKKKMDIRKKVREAGRLSDYDLKRFGAKKTAGAATKKKPVKKKW